MVVVVIDWWWLWFGGPSKSKVNGHEILLFLNHVHKNSHNLCLSIRTPNSCVHLGQPAIVAPRRVSGDWFSANEEHDDDDKTPRCH